MAHADYSCCAVCDRKMSYGDDATKETICPECIEKLNNLGVQVFRVSQLTAWMKEAPKEFVRSVLDAVGFNLCFYHNEVDELYESIFKGDESLPAPLSSSSEMTVTLKMKLGSLIVHADEITGPGAVPDFDGPAIRTLLGDQEIKDFLASIDPALLPVKRSGV